MTSWSGSLPSLLSVVALVAASGCGDTGNSSGSATETTTAATETASSTAATDSGPTTSGSDSNSNSNSNSEGTGSASMTSSPTTDPTSSTTNTSMTSSTSASTTEPDTSTTMPVSTTDTNTTGPDTTTGASDSDSSTDTSSTTDSGSSSSGSSSTGPDCVPIAETCNDLDDDCDGIVDNLDLGGDGICDCLDIAIFGNEGANPSAEFQAWLEAQGTQVDRISLDNTPITQQILDQYDIIILDWLVRSYTPQEAALIEGWVTSGGGLMSMTGHTNNNTVVDRPNSVIAPMGLSYNASKGFFSGPVTQWAPHPVAMGITSVSFFGGLYINIVDDGLGVNEVIGTLPQGPVAVGQVRKAGKLFIFGDEWIEFDSEWQQIPQIKQLWVNILAWLSPQNFCTIPQ